MAKYTQEQIDRILPILRKVRRDKLRPDVDEEMSTLLCNTWLCGPHSWYCLDTDTYRHEWRINSYGDDLLAHPERFLRQDSDAMQQGLDTKSLKIAYVSGLTRAAQIAREGKSPKAIAEAIEAEAAKARPS